MKKSLSEKIRKELQRFVTHIQTGSSRRDLRSQIEEKWEKDLTASRLTKDHKDLYVNIHRHHAETTGRFPDIIDPQNYNDKIAWIMLFDQHPELVAYMDKIAVRDFVESRIGEQFLTRLYTTGDSFDALDLDALPGSFVMKSNHDSGTVILVENKEQWDWQTSKKDLSKSLSRSYGLKKGEWAYRHIPRKLLAEEFLGKPGDPPPPDFKFHCSNGRVKWLQYIYDRGPETKEATYDRNFKPLPLLLDQDFTHSEPLMTKPDNWDKLVETAEKLAAGFKYVRVDLYNLNDRIIFGELTFLPKAGCYTTEDNLTFGKMLELDTQTTCPPVYHLL